MKKVFYLCAVFALMAICANLVGVFSVYAEPTAINSILTSDDLQGIAGDMVFANDINVDASTWESVESYSGELDGCGNTIIIDITNLESPEEGFIVPPTIFSSLNNATISNLKIIVSFEGDLPGSLSYQFASSNYGILANSANNCRFYNVEVGFSNEKGNILFTIYCDGMSAIGGLVGNLFNGTSITNCKVSNLNFAVEQISTISVQNTMVGAVCGSLTNSTLSNIVVSNANIACEQGFEDYEGQFLIGGLVGYANGNSSQIKNCVVESKLYQNQLNASVGNFVGYIEREASLGAIESSGAKCLVGIACYDGNNSLLELSAFGNISLQSFTSYLNNYLLAQQKATYCLSPIYSSDFWDKVFEWNFISVWDIMPNSLPILQAFEMFEISVNNTALIVSDEAVNVEIISIASSIDDELKYGQSVTITASINKDANVAGHTIDFSKFFTISGLRLNGNDLYPLSSASISESEEVSWIIPTMNKAYEGEYSVSLSKKRYTFKAVVDNTAEGVDKNGKIRQSNSNTLLNEIVIDNVEYGASYTIYSKANDLFDSSLWKIKNQTTYTQLTEGTDGTTIVNANKFQFTFDYKDAFTSAYFFGEDYVQIDENDATNTWIEIAPVFASASCNVDVVIKIDGIILEDRRLFSLYIDEELISLFQKAIATNTKEFRIVFDENKYIFTNWAVESSEDLAIITDDGDTPITNINFTTNDSAVTISANFEEIIIEQDLLWLWILLGSIGGALLIFVIVMLIVKSKNRDRSYRNFY